MREKNATVWGVAGFAHNCWPEKIRFVPSVCPSWLFLLLLLLSLCYSSRYNPPTRTKSIVRSTCE